MENLLRKYDLISKTGRYTEESERRRDVIASLLDDRGRFEGTKEALMARAHEEFKKVGLGAPGTTQPTQKNLAMLRLAYQWIVEGKKVGKLVVGEYLHTLWGALNEKFPYEGEPELAFKAAELTEAEPTPVAVVPPPTLPDPIGNFALAMDQLLRAWTARFDTLEAGLRELRNGGHREQYVPPVPQAPIPLKESDLLSSGFETRYFGWELPTKSEKNQWAFYYSERFRRSFKRSPDGIHSQIVRALETLSKHGESYPGLGFKALKMQRNRGLEALRRGGARMFHMRANRTWRIILNTEPGEKRYYFEVVAAHNDKVFYKR